jgi:hypothetical protein
MMATGIWGFRRKVPASGRTKVGFQVGGCGPVARAGLLLHPLGLRRGEPHGNLEARTWDGQPGRRELVPANHNLDTVSL